MDVQVAQSGPCRKTLTIKVPAEKIRDQVDEAYQAASHQVEFKGFRKGKVPRRVLEQRLGAEILAEAKQNIIKTSFDEAMRSQKLNMIGQPEVEGIDEGPLDQESPLEFQVHVEIRPEITVGEVKGIEIKRASTEVTDEDLAQALAQLADQKKTLRQVDEPAQANDFVKGDLTFRDENGVAISERKAVQLNTRIPIAGTDPEVFSSKLEGTSTGKTISMELTFPDNFEQEAQRGKQGKVEFAVTDVLRITPAPIDDALAKDFDYPDLEALKEDLKKRIGHEKQLQERARQEEQIIEILISSHPFDLPRTVVEDQAKHNLETYARALKENRVDEEEIRSRLAEAQTEAHEEAERRVRAYFLLEAVARKEKIFVTEGDVDTEIRAIAAQSQAKPADVRSHYEAREMLADLRASIMERKVRDFLRDQAAFTD